MNIAFGKLLKRVFEKALYEEDILSTGAQVAFYFTFALFPLLLFLISLFGIILESADEFRAEMFTYLRQIMPYSAFSLVQTTIKEVTESSSGSKLTIGLLIALWSASAGVDSLRIALNSVFNLKETRSWFKTKFLALTLTFSLTLLIMVALSIVFYGSKVIKYVFDFISLPIESQFFLGSLQIITVLVVLMSIFGIIYNFMPSYRPLKWHWVTPGAIVGIVLWLLLSYAFRLYLEYFNTYARTYGSLGAVIILMLWLYLTALVILIGGIVNAIIQEQNDPEIEKESKEKSVEKLEQQKAALPSEQVDEMIEEKKKEGESGEKNETKKNKKDDDKEVSNEIEKNENIKVSKNKNNLEVVAVRNRENTRLNDQNSDEVLESARAKNIAGLTAVGIFGFLMGLIFRKKGD